MTAKKKFPDIRFKGFAGEWEEKTLGDLAKIRMCKRIFAEQTTTSGDIPFFKIGTFGKEPDAFISRNLYEEYKRKFSFPRKGDILISAAGTLGRTVVYDGSPAYFQDSNIVWLELDETRLCNEYLHPYYQVAKWTSEGSTILRLYNGIIRSTNINYPPTKPEQARIGEFFKTLDGLISLAREKHERTLNIKKAMFLRMFPQKGEKVPQVRFKGFTREWEEKELKECAEFNPKSLLPDEFEYVDLESVVGTEMISHRRESRMSAPSRAQRLAKQGDVFYQTVRPYQKNNYLFDLPCTNYVFSTGYAQIRPNIDGRFLFAILYVDSFIKSVLDKCTGTSFPAINANDLAKIKIYVPNNEDEQKAIGKFFRQLDDLLSCYRRQLGKLQNIKAACLQGMFA